MNIQQWSSPIWEEERGGGTAPADELPLEGIRILVLMPSIPVQGMERATLQIFRMMRARGAIVRFVVEATYGDRVRTEVERSDCEWVPARFDAPLRLPRGPVDAARMLRAARRASADVEQAIRDFRPSVLHVTNLAYFLYALPAIRKASVPAVFRAPNPPDLTLDGFRRAIFDRLWRRAATASSLVVCNCDYARRRLEAVGVPATKIRLVRNCVPERASTERDSPRLDPEDFNIAFLGRIQPQKGPRELFEAVTRLLPRWPRLRVVFAGEYSWRNSFADALREEVARHPAAERFRFLEQIDDVFGLLAQCRLHVAPSTSETESFPNVVLEAKRQGVPSVVFPTGGLTEAVTHPDDGWICRDRSAVALAQGIEYFLENAELLERARTAARDSLARFSPDRCAREWTDIFRRLAA